MIDFLQRNNQHYVYELLVNFLSGGLLMLSRIFWYGLSFKEIYNTWISLLCKAQRSVQCDSSILFTNKHEEGLCVVLFHDDEKNKFTSGFI